MNQAVLMVLKEIVDWMQSPEGRAIPQVDGQPGRWMNKATELIHELEQFEKGEIITIKTTDLRATLEKIRALNQFKADAETDIGYLAETVYNLQNIGDPMKMLTKIMMGKLDLKALGLDIDRLQAISEKYAPATTAKLKALEESKPKK
jgi:hypothetical protein